MTTATPNELVGQIPLVEDGHVVRIEVARVEGVRPRMAGCNARLDVHGMAVHPSLDRLTLEERTGTTKS